MAKLSAHGYPIAKLRLERKPKDLETSSIIQAWRHIAIMSDRWIMKKYQVRFKPDTYYPKGRLQDWGWHRFGKVKAELNLQDIVRKYIANGYQAVD